jgi:hypothetical protein
VRPGAHWRTGEAASQILPAILLAAALALLSGCSGPTWQAKQVQETLVWEQILKWRAYVEAPVWLAIWGAGAVAAARSSAASAWSRKAGEAAGSAGCCLVLVFFAAVALKPAFHVVTKHDRFILSPEGVTEIAGGRTSSVKWAELAECGVSERTVSDTEWRLIERRESQYERTIEKTLSCRSEGHYDLAKMRLNIPLERRSEGFYKVSVSFVFGSDDFKTAPGDQKLLLDYVRQRRPQDASKLDARPR